MWSKQILVLVVVSVLAVDSARILGVFPIPSISHQVIFQSIWKELSLRGHQVTVLTPNPLNDPTLTNLTEIDFGHLYGIMEKADITKVLGKENSMFFNLLTFFKLMNTFMTEMLNHPSVKKITEDPNQNFDLIMVETHAPSFYAFAARFQAPIVGISSLGLFLNTHDTVGNPTHPILAPDILLNFVGEMGYSDKLYSVFYNLWYRLVYHWHVLPEATALVRKHFGNDATDLAVLERNVSLILVNTNPILHPIRPNVPNVIGMEQMHIKPTKPLPKDLQKYLDDSPQGVIYFSLGSNVKSANLSKTTRETIISALSQLPYNVLWKWETDHLPNQPKNVRINKWLPQQDILGHRNIKAFVTQGGLQSMEEAIANGVPLVGMPFFGDQPLNVQKMVKMGIAQSVDFVTMTKEILKDTIVEVAENPKYREKIVRLKELLNDQPMKSLDRAIWWIEYVLRHQGATHLRYPAVDLTWYEFYALDAFAVVFGGGAAVLYILYKIYQWSSSTKSNKLKIN